jgi:hypothetical protein
MVRIDRRRLVQLVLVTTVAVLTVGQVSAVAGGGKGGGGGTRCSRRSPCDTTPPTISILNPASGTSTSGVVTVTAARRTTAR